MSRKSRPVLDTELYIYRIPFDGCGELPAKEIVGSKAHNLMRMARRGLPVPPGFVFGTGLCRDYLKRGPVAFAGLEKLLDPELEQLASVTGRRLGDARPPLLLSVRSGAVMSMPGMMETVLNIGMTDATTRGLARVIGNPRLAADCQRRLIAQYAEVVHDIPIGGFDQLLRRKLAEQQATSVAEIDTDGMRELAGSYLDVFTAQTGRSFPTAPLDQLTAAIEAVVKSWMSDRAQAYRKMNAIPESVGTAAIVQQMVFGNAGPTSGSGVGFTRNPSDGSSSLYVDFLANAQGEDVVSGRFTVQGMGELEKEMPEVHRNLLVIADELEREFGDMQDFEFTVERGRLYMLQARSGKRTPLAALRIASDLVKENKITAKGAISLLKDIDLDAIESIELLPPAGVEPLAVAVPSSAGVASGVAVFDPERVAVYKQKRKPIVLVRETTETADIKSLADATALVTAQGARTSHAAVVARQLGLVCVVGCREITIDIGLRSSSFGGIKVQEGDMLTVDGSSGAIYLGALPTRRSRPEELLKLARSWSA